MKHWLYTAIDSSPRGAHMSNDKDPKHNVGKDSGKGSSEHGSRQINEQKNLTLEHLRDKVASKPRPDNKTGQS